MAEQTADENEKGAKKEKAPRAPMNVTNLLLIIVIGVLLLAIVGGAFATIMIYRSGSGHGASAQQTEVAAEEGEKSDGKTDKAEKTKDGEKKKDAKEPKKDDKPKGPAIYVTLEPPFVVNFAAGKPAKFLQITMEIMTREAICAQLLKDNNPLLRNDLLMLFGNTEYDAVASGDGREALRAKALDVVRGVVKKEGGKPSDVEAIYFTSLVMQ